MGARAPGGQGAREDLRLRRRRLRGGQGRRDPRGGRRLAGAVPRRRVGDGLHRTLRLERPRPDRPDLRGGAAGGGRRLLRAGRVPAAPQASPRGLGRGLTGPTARRPDGLTA